MTWLLWGGGGGNEHHVVIQVLEADLPGGKIIGYWAYYNYDIHLFLRQIGFQSNDGNTREILFNSESELLDLPSQSNLIEHTAGVYAYKVDGLDRIEPSCQTGSNAGKDHDEERYVLTGA